MDRYEKFDIFINKLCFILLIICLILFPFLFSILRVDADVLQWNSDYLKQPYTFSANDMSSSTSIGSSIKTNGYMYTDNKNYFNYGEQKTIGTSGNFISFYLNEILKPGYIYNISTLYCSTTDVSNLQAESFASNVSTFNLKNIPSYRYDLTYSISSMNVTIAGVDLTHISAFQSFSTCYSTNSIVSPTSNSPWFGLRLYSSKLSSPQRLVFMGYEISNLGAYSPSLESNITKAVQSAVNSSTQQTQQSISQLNEEIKQMTSEQEKTNQTLDDIKDMEGSESTDPLDKDSVDSVDSAEKDLLNQNVDTGSLDISIDSNSNIFVWDIINRFVQSNSYVFGAFISILTLGVVSLILNR